MLEVFELYLTCNSSIFNNENYLQTDGTAQETHMSRSYADIVMADIDKEALNIISVPQRGKGLGMIFLYFGRIVENL